MESLDFFTNEYAFLTPLLLPWLQKLCRDSAEDQLKVLFETELATPLQLLSRSNFSYRHIRQNIVPRLITHIESAHGSTEMYLRQKLYAQFHRQIEDNNDEELHLLASKLLSNDRSDLSRDELTSITLNARQFELFLDDILSDLFAAANVGNILSIDRTQIIQYIRCLIYECEKNVKQNAEQINFECYSGLICCNLLSILNDEYAAECVCDSEDGNLSNFKVFTDIINENNSQLPALKNENESLKKSIKHQQASKSEIGVNALHCAQ